MRVVGFILINLFLIVLNLAFAGFALAFFFSLKAIIPGWMDEPVVAYAIAIAALAATLWFMFWSARMFPKLIEWLVSSRERARE